MDQCDLEFEDFEGIEAQIEAARAWDEASCAEHYWCARFLVSTKPFVGPEIDIPF